jgi:hypothetical protein
MTNGSVTSSHRITTAAQQHGSNSSKEQTTVAPKQTAGATTFDAKSRPKNAPAVIAESKSCSQKTVSKSVNTDRLVEGSVNSASLASVTSVKVNSAGHVMNGVRNAPATLVESNNCLGMSQMKVNTSDHVVSASATSTVQHCDLKKSAETTSAKGHKSVNGVDNTDCVKVSKSASSVVAAERSCVQSVSVASHKDRSNSGSNPKKQAVLNTFNTAPKSAEDKRSDVFTVRATTPWHVSSISDEKRPEKNSTVHATTVWHVKRFKTSSNDAEEKKPNYSSFKSGQPTAKTSTCNGEMKCNNTEVSAGTPVVRNAVVKQKCSDDDYTGDAVATCNGSSATKPSPNQMSQSTFHQCYVLEQLQ